jgi:MinD-like ATPase involved in chromosome partitioning or flagellar assembly
MTHNRVLREHIHVVAVGTGYAGELPVTAVKKVLGISALHCIPDDPVSTIRAVNVGNPLVLEMPRTKISQAIVAFTNALIGQTEDNAMVASPPQLGAMKAAAVIALNTLPFCK